jgi:hypothetical protein
MIDRFTASEISERHGDLGDVEGEHLQHELGRGVRLDAASGEREALEQGLISAER